MNIKALQVRIQNISFWRLCHVVIYKISHQLYLNYQRIRTKLFPDKIRLLNVKGINVVDNDLYYSFCCTDIKSVVVQANEVINDRILLFDNTFDYSQLKWLSDPITKKQWDNDVFSPDAKFEVPGYGDVKYVLEYNKFGHLVKLAQGYFLTGEEKYLCAISERLDQWVEQVKPQKSVVKKIMLDSGFRIINLVHICMLARKSEYFKINTLPLLLGIIKVESDLIEKYSTPRWYKFSSGANHTIGEMVGYLVGRLFLMQYGIKTSYQAIQKSFYYLYKCLANIVTDKGVYLEQSAGYSRLVTEFLILLDLMILKSNDNLVIKWYERKYLYLLLRYIDSLSFGGIMPDFGDNDGAVALYPFVNRYDKIGHILNYIDYSGIAIKRTNTILCQRSGQFIWKSPKVKLFMRAGAHSFFSAGGGSHSHNDMLAILLSYSNEEIFIDKGTYLYNSGIVLRNCDRATLSHNTLTIDGVEQAPFLDKWSYATLPKSAIISSLVDNDVFHVEAECCYGQYKHIRTLDYKSDCLKIYDCVTGQYTSTKVYLTFLLSPRITVTINENGTGVILKSHRGIEISVVIDKRLQLSIEKTDFSPKYGSKIQTHKIVAVGTIDPKYVIVTTLRFDNEKTKID